MYKFVAIYLPLLVIVGCILNTEAGFGFSTCDIIAEHRKTLSGYGQEECEVFGNCWDDANDECYKKIQCRRPTAEDVECGGSGIKASECKANGCVWRDSYCHVTHKCYQE